MFPVYAGVSGRSGSLSRARSGIPRARGGFRRPLPLLFSCYWYSPRTRGFQAEADGRILQDTVFPVYAGVSGQGGALADELGCVPRVRGGFRRSWPLRMASWRCSPCTRGFQASRMAASAKKAVFPAHAGVSERAWPGVSTGCSVPRVRGGFRICARRVLNSSQCSPCTRGFQDPGYSNLKIGFVFPAHAGVSV